MDRKTRHSTLYVLIVTGVLSAFGPFVTDFYLPALPALSGYFRTTASMVQLSLTFSMVGLAFGQLVIGPLSDKYGRKPPLQISLGLFSLSTIGCLSATGIHGFVFFRLLQGIAGAGGVVVSRSIATDLYRGRELARFFSMLGSVQGIAPIGAPVLGGVLLEVMEWKGIFGMLFVLGLLLMAAVACLREPLPAERRQQGSVLSTFHHYLPVLRHSQFMYYVWIQAFAMGVMFVYIAASPFIFQTRFGMSPLAYGLCFGVNALGIMAGSLMVSRFADASAALHAGIKGFACLSLPVAAALLAAPSVWIVEGTLFLFLVFLGVILPSSTTLALDLERENSGNASALLGFLTFIFGGVLSPLTGLGDMLSTTALLIVACCAGAWICNRKTDTYFYLLNNKG